ncbi:Isochorismatase [Pleurostoma richardsiae]|uniref:Isochorismatase n=1 Tax=Pleurostoma richardsiae TaxID=41990 RepID=A0AA38R7N8_9PEZI|nr:Isochorismatase [Pleurostoma richardsiae]
MTTPGADTMTFGPAGDQWTYSRRTRTYDLTRGRSSAEGRPSLTIGTTQGPAGTSIAVDPAASALVVVDMQNFFLHPDCRDHPAGLAAVEPTIRVVEKCREAGIKIIWLNWGLTDADLASMPAGVQRGFARALIDADPAAAPADPPPCGGLGADLGRGQGRCLMAGEWNSAVYGALGTHVRPDLGDAACAKNRMSGLWSPAQPLWRELERGATRTLLFAGVNTDQCVLGTLADAYGAGWDCVMVEDCCATTTEAGREVCLYNVSMNYGFVVDSNAIVAAKLQ